MSCDEARKRPNSFGSLKTIWVGGGTYSGVGVRGGTGGHRFDELGSSKAGAYRNRVRGVTEVGTMSLRRSGRRRFLWDVLWMLFGI